MRGGGAVLFGTNDTSIVKAICGVQARHTLDTALMNASMYFGVINTGLLANPTTYILALDTFFSNATTEQTIVAFAPLFEDVVNAGDVLSLNTSITANINEILATNDDDAGKSAVLRSRLIPESFNRQSPSLIGRYVQTTHGNWYRPDIDKPCRWWQDSRKCLIQVSRQQRPSSSSSMKSPDKEPVRRFTLQDD
ncbi:hypothetical protein NP233_g1071 [Leucocoprinus birnbaumii]|uniref:Uncharacterized protein n=1 Tax=Leucocoprinus birnbaumii TaxID=56174 RepID=A0AAD5YY90_9AGAR|nr:hypothetical protein NP233_g1071 [Leucocoprinus birnbaumii]